MILIKNGYLIDASTGKEGEFDILIEGSTIKDIGNRGQFSKAETSRVIDAGGKWILPGLVDLHVHLREPGQEWKETIKSGCEAAVLGGYTTILAMPNTKPVNDHAEVTRFILERAKKINLARVLPIGAVTKGLEGKEMAPYSELREAGCVAFSDDGEPVYNAGIMRRALEWCSMLGVSIACHEEDKCLSCGGAMNESGLASKLGLKGWPKVAEEVMIARDIELARTTKAKTHICHVSTARGIELIRRAKNDGISITAEVTPHHLLLSEDAIGEYDTNAKMSPPLREEEDLRALQVGLKDGTVDAIASDHAPHDKDSKQIEFGRAAFGILGLQTSFPLILSFVHNGTISKLRAVELLSSGPARAFNLEAGTLKKGAEADLIVVDPNPAYTFNRESIRSISTNSPFIGREMRGTVETVLVGGVVKVEDQNLLGEA